MSDLSLREKNCGKESAGRVLREKSAGKNPQ
jgi:hypothetical protein